MTSATVLMSRLMSMMIMVIIGYVIVKLHIVESKDSKILSSLVVFILQPCLICRAFQIEITPERTQGFIASMIFGIVVYITWIIVSTVLSKPLKLDSIDISTLIYGNVGNLMLPLINMILGSEYVFYASALQIPFNLFVWTHSQTIISERKGINIRKIILNPNIIALFTGLLLCILQIRIPTIIDTAMEGFAGMVGPCSMLVVGIVIAGSDLKSVFTLKRAYLISFGRLIFMPLIALLLLKVSGVFTRSPELLPILSVPFIAMCAPAAATVSQLAVLYDKNPLEASIYNVLTMLACVITMPLMLALFQLVFGTPA